MPFLQNYGIAVDFSPHSEDKWQKTAHDMAQKKVWTTKKENYFFLFSARNFFILSCRDAGTRTSAQKYPVRLYFIPYFYENLPGKDTAIP